MTVVLEVAFCMNMISMILASVVLEVARFRHTNHLILSLCLVDPNITVMVDWALKPNFFSVLFLFTRI